MIPIGSVTAGATFATEAIFETFLLLFASQTFETATQRGARLIRTGQAQMANLDAEEFKTEICEAMALLLNCMNNLMVDVRTYADFGAVDLANPIDEDGNLITTFEYDPGDAGEIVMQINLGMDAREAPHRVEVLDDQREIVQPVRGHRRASHF